MWRIFFLFPFFVFAKPLNFHAKAESVLLMNLETGNSLYEKNAHEKRCPASLTKIATALFALRQMGDHLEKSFVCYPECLIMTTGKAKEAQNYTLPAHFLEPEGTHYYLQAGEEMTFRDLLYGLMLSSGNDAANVIAKNVSGSIDQFMQEMNVYLKKIGCKNTHFMNPHGLYHPEHLTTAYDLMLMTKEALKIPIFRQVVSSASFDRPETNKQGMISISQHNQLLKQGKFFYPNAFGVKTGYIKKAGSCIVSVAEGAGRVLAIALLNAEDKQDLYREVISLFDMAFSEKKEKRLVFKGGENLFSKEVKKTKKNLQAVLKEDVEIEYFPSEEPCLETRIFWKEDISLPVNEGDAVGEICIYDRDKDLIHVPLYALYSLEKKFMYKCFEQFYLLWLLGLIPVGFLIFRKSNKKSSKARS